jgi:hypothetical protein
MVPMTEQTFARGLWLSLLPLFVRLTWITGFDGIDGDVDRHAALTGMLIVRSAHTQIGRRHLTLHRDRHAVAHLRPALGIQDDSTLRQRSSRQSRTSTLFQVPPRSSADTDWRFERPNGAPWLKEPEWRK